MKGSVFLAWKYLRYYKGISITLLIALAVVEALPLAFNGFVRRYNRLLRERAEDTPLVMGARGNRYDLVLKLLYFTTDYSESITMSDLEEVRDSAYGTPHPLHVRYSAQRFSTSGAPGQGEAAPVVGTSMGYFAFRGLEARAGTPPLLLGDAVAGSRAAARLGIGVGDFVLTAPRSVYDQAESFQLKMPVVGVFAPTGTPDDEAVFVDVKTAWVLDGIGHGHVSVDTITDSRLVDSARSTPGNLVATVGLARYAEITDSNRASFHFHGAPEAFPLTGIVLEPRDLKARTMALGRYAFHETRMLLEPAAVVEELMGFVFRIRQFVNANYLVLGGAVVLLIGLIFVLTFRLRARELETLFKLGTSRAAVAQVAAFQVLILLAGSLAVAWVGARGLTALASLYLPALGG